MIDVPLNVVAPSPECILLDISPKALLIVCVLEGMEDITGFLSWAVVTATDDTACSVVHVH